jgi:hypothetical protein
MVVSGLEDLRRRLPAFPEPLADTTWEEAFPPDLFPTVALDGDLEGEIDNLTHAAWCLERISLGRPPEPQEGEPRPTQPVGYWPPVAMPPDPDPVAATRQEVAADTVVLRGLIAALETARRRLRQRLREASAPKHGRRRALELEAVLESLLEASLKPALEVLQALPPEGAEAPAPSGGGSA